MQTDINYTDNYMQRVEQHHSCDDIYHKIDNIKTLLKSYEEILSTHTKS